MLPVHYSVMFCFGEKQTQKNTPEILIIILLGKLGFSPQNNPMISTATAMDPK